MHKFRIMSAAKGYKVQFVYNSEVMVWSETYTSKASAKNCVASLKKNAPAAATVDLGAEEKAKGYRFEIVGSKDGQFFVRFIARNGETMVRSETYAAKKSAVNCVDSIKKRAAEAPVEDDAKAKPAKVKAKA